MKNKTYKNQPKKIEPFNPLDKTNLGESVAEALLLQPVGPLPPDDPFYGAGVYAIYYEGDFEPYKDVVIQNKGGAYKWPIYVGKAVPAGARKGGYGLGADPGVVLYKRLIEHADSIGQAENLNVKDFSCRFLVVDDIWIPLAESLLIEMFAPLWNRKIDGFGNHDPGGGRYEQQVSPWDVMHPGRKWVKKLKRPPSDEQSLREGAVEYLTRIKGKISDQASVPPPKDIH